MGLDIYFKNFKLRELKSINEHCFYSNNNYLLKKIIKILYEKKIISKNDISLYNLKEFFLTEDILEEINNNLEYKEEIINELLLKIKKQEIIIFYYSY